MVFSSLLFVYLFLPLTILLYYIAKLEYRNYILLLASILFYAYGEPQFVFIMIFSIVANYGLALGISHFQNCENQGLARLFLLFDVLTNIGLLYIFKYLDFSFVLINKLLGFEIPMLGIPLPIGISFFTFQALSYVIDVYRGTVNVQKNPLYVALYISFFPQLIAGPIVRYSTIEQQIEKRTCSVEMFSDGIRRFFLGFCKKVLLANNLSVVATEVWRKGAINEVNPSILWLGAVCFSLQIYYDFSGYSDMAIGLGKLFGFSFEENFNYPYISKSVTEFWRRWHMSLGQWFRDYVYIPLGGSRVPFAKHILNLLIVWLLTGIWHGASMNFIVWGLMYFVMLVIEKYCVRPEKRKNVVFRVVWQLLTILIVIFGWVIFNTNGVKNGVEFCLAMLGHYHIPFIIDSEFIYYYREYGVFITLGIIFATPIVPQIKSVVADNKCFEVIRTIVVPIIYGLLFLWGISFLILGSHNPFIYFNF